MADMSKSNVKAGIVLVVGLLLVTLLAAELLPVAFDAWFNASTSSWNSAVAAIWVIVPIFALIAIPLYYLGQAFNVF